MPVRTMTDVMTPGAIHIPLDELNARLGVIHQTRPVIITCRSGNHSARIAEALMGAGFTADTTPGGMTVCQTRRAASQLKPRAASIS